MSNNQITTVLSNGKGPSKELKATGETTNENAQYLPYVENSDGIVSKFAESDPSASSNNVESISDFLNNRPDIAASIQSSRNAGVISNSDFFPDMKTPIRVGTYAGSIVGSVPIFAYGGAHIPLAAMAKREADLESKVSMATKMMLRPLDFKLRDAGGLYQRKLDDYTLEKISYFNNIASQYGVNGWDYIRSGNSPYSNDYFRFVSNTRTLAKEFKTITSIAANIRSSEGKFVLPKKMYSLVDKILSASLEIDNGKISGTDIGELVGKLKVFHSISKIMQNDWGKISKDVSSTFREKYMNEYLGLSSEAEKNAFIKEKISEISEDRIKEISKFITMSYPESVWDGNGDRGDRPYTVKDIEDFARTFIGKNIDKSVLGLGGRSININTSETKDYSASLNYFTNAADVISKSYYLNKNQSSGGGSFVDYEDGQITSGAYGATFLYDDGTTKFVPYSDKSSFFSAMAKLSKDPGKSFGLSANQNLQDMIINFSKSGKGLNLPKYDYDGALSDASEPASDAMQAFNKTVKWGGVISLGNGIALTKINGDPYSGEPFSFNIRNPKTGAVQDGAIVPGELVTDEAKSGNDFIILSNNMMFLPGVKMRNIVSGKKSGKYELVGTTGKSVLRSSANFQINKSTWEQPIYGAYDKIRDAIINGSTSPNDIPVGYDSSLNVTGNDPFSVIGEKLSYYVGEPAAISLNENAPEVVNFISSSGIAPKDFFKFSESKLKEANDARAERGIVPIRMYGGDGKFSNEYLKFLKLVPKHIELNNE